MDVHYHSKVWGQYDFLLEKNNKLYQQGPMKLTKGGRKDIYNHVTKDLSNFSFLSSKNPAFHEILRNVYTGWTEDIFLVISMQKASVWIDSY